MLDQIEQMGISPDPQTGRLMFVYLDINGQKKMLDLTATIEQAAAAAVKKHEKDYHGGFD